MDRCHASLRETSATICSNTVTASTNAEASESAAENSSPRPASTNARIAVVATEPTIVISVRWRRPKPRRRAISWAGQFAPIGATLYRILDC
jgi:hypothetical protein